MFLRNLRRFRLPIITLWIALLVVFFAALTHKLLLSEKTIIDNSVGIWFDQKDPELVDYQAYNDTFGDKEWSILLLQTESIYNPEFLSQVDTLTQQIEALDNVIKVTSITNIRDNFSSDDGALDYRRLYSNNVLQDSAALAEYREQLAANPVFERNLILSDDERYTVVLIQNDNLVYSQSNYRIKLVDAITQSVNEHSLIQEHALAGTTVVNAELNRAAIRDVFVFYTLVTVLLTLIAFYMLRSIRNLVVMYAVVMTSALPAMGLLAVLGIAFNIMTVMLPTVLIALSVAGVIHIISEFHQLRAEHSSESAMQKTLQHLYKPTLWTTLTTVVGFAVFTTSNVNPVFQFGAIAAFGLVMACVANLIIAPLLLVWLWPDNIPSPETLQPRSMPAWLTVGQHSPKRVLLMTMLLAIPLLGLFKLEVDTNYIKFFSSSHPTTQSYEAIKQSGFAQNPVIVHLRYAEDKRYSSSSIFSATRSFESAISSLPEVIKILSPGDFLQEINIAFNGARAGQLQSYDKAQVDQLLLLGELSGNDDLSDLFVDGGSDVQFVVLTDYLGNRDLEQFSSQLRDLQRKHLPESVNMKITGTTTLWANMDEDVTLTQIGSLLLISLFLAFFLPLIFGSLKLGLVGLTINMLPLSVALGTMALLEIKINMATALVGAMSLGVVVDDTIHFISSIIRQKREGHGTEVAVDLARGSVGFSIVRTTFVLVVGFSCMATSQFLPTAHFGVFIALSIGLALILDLFCLPALLRCFPGLVDRVEKTTAPLDSGVVRVASKAMNKTQ